MGRRRLDGVVEDRCLERMRPGEPFFVLRAQDKLAVDRVLDWFHAAKATLTKEHADEVVAWLNEAETWQREHPELVKLPD